MSGSIRGDGMRGDNIILTGMPGSGKSTVGVILARDLVMGFLDTDILIQKNAGRTLQDIVDKDGHEALLAIEERVVCGLDIRHTVVAPGGSVVLSERTMGHLHRCGIVVFLDVPLDNIAGRIDLYTRGMVKAPGETLEDVWRRREPLYRASADIVIDCRGLDQLRVAQAIDHALRA